MSLFVQIYKWQSNACITVSQQQFKPANPITNSMQSTISVKTP